MSTQIKPLERGGGKGRGRFWIAFTRYATVVSSYTGIYVESTSNHDVVTPKLRTLSLRSFAFKNSRSDHLHSYILWLNFVRIYRDDYNALFLHIFTRVELWTTTFFFGKTHADGRGFIRFLQISPGQLSVECEHLLSGNLCAVLSARKMCEWGSVGWLRNRLFW